MKTASNERHALRFELINSLSEHQGILFVCDSDSLNRTPCTPVNVLTSPTERHALLSMDWQSQQKAMHPCQCINSPHRTPCTPVNVLAASTERHALLSMY